MLVIATPGCKETFDESDFGEKTASGDFVIEMAVNGTGTKTTISDDKAIYFSVGDQVNVFHSFYSDQGAYASYANDGCFTVTEVNDGIATLKGTLSEDLNPAKAYDWFAVYPYNPESKNPENVRVKFPTSVTVSGDPAQALAGSHCPLAGSATNVASSDTPRFRMNQLASVVRIDIFSTLDDDSSLTGLELSSSEDIAGEFVYDIHKFESHNEDFDLVQYVEDDGKYDIVENNYPRYTVVGTIEGKKNVSVSASDITLEPYFKTPAYIPVAPTTFRKLGSSLTVRVNDCIKPVTMKSMRFWCSNPKFLNVRQMFLPGIVNSFAFNYCFADIENYPLTWSNKVNGSYVKIPSWFYSDVGAKNYMACTSTIPAVDSDDSFAKYAYIWLQSKGCASARRVTKGEATVNHIPYAYSLWEDEAIVFVIPVLHLSAGSTLAIETSLMAGIQGMVRNEHSYTDPSGGWPDVRSNGGAAYFRCEYSTDCGKTWKDASVQSEYAIKDGPRGANFCISKEEVGCYAKALCNIPSEMTGQTILYRMRCVNASFSATDVKNGAATGGRIDPSLQVDQYNEPDTYTGKNSLQPLDGKEDGVYARVSVVQ